MENVLVLGGTGFIGRNIVEHLLEDGCKVVLLTRRSDFKLEDSKNLVHLIVEQGSIADLELIKNILKQHHITSVLHLVSNLIPASTHEEFKEEILQVVLPTFELIHHLAQLHIRFFFFSSGGAVYGHSEYSISEDHDLNPINYYGYCKLMIESHIRFLAKSSQLNYIIIRPSNAYGKYQRSYGNQGFVAVALRKILSNEPIVIWGNGTVIRDYIYVEDLCITVKHIIRSAATNETFNVGSGEGVALLKVIELMKYFLRREAQIEFQEKRLVDTNQIILNVEKVATDFGFKARNIHDGLRDYISSLTFDAK